MAVDSWHSKVDLFVTPPKFKDSVKRSFEVLPGDFDTVAAKKSGRFVIIGFDTEFKTPDFAMTREEIGQGFGKYTVVSYQFHCVTSDGDEWNGICCPDAGDRINLNDFVVFALGDGARNHSIVNIPTAVYLVGHFTRADMPAFSDFHNLKDYFSNVRNTFISIGYGKKVQFAFEGTGHVPLTVMFRDTMLLTPQTSRKLSGIGELIGCPKLRLGDSDKDHAKLIKNMDRTILSHWDSFRAYAIQDATIAAKYMERICAQYEEVTGERKVPVTLSSIGVSLLQKKWKSISKDAELLFLGIEEYTEKAFDKNKGCFIRRKERRPIEEVWHETLFVTETYHGGRNEQFWFGPGFEDNWCDFDLTSAYPTAMSIIGKPDWKGMRRTNNVEDFQPDTLGFAWVDFKFPADTRYPTLPVRTANGLVFPLQGLSYCAAPEIVLAKSLGASMTIKTGLIVPTDQSVKIFGEFIRDCLEERKKAGPKTLEGLFWKEISNSTYGKTAQGLREKRVYDMKEMMTKVLPESPLTNAYFASFITSFVRAVLGELINGLPSSKYVFSCTTDGFLTNATEEEVALAEKGLITTTFKAARKVLVGVEEAIEIKHHIRKPLGWRTRGQATLIKGDSMQGEDFSVVLAKGGIYTPAEYDTDALQNDLVVDMFFNRQADQVMKYTVLTGVRDIVEVGSDLVEKAVSKRLGMEFDWKRCPLGLGYSNTHQHVLYSTKPWKTVEQFESIRETWETYTKNNKQCIKTLDDYKSFSDRVEAVALMDTPDGKYLRKKDGDLARLRQLLCSAWKHSAAGISQETSELSAREFAEFLTSCGIPCKKTDVENAKNRLFRPKTCPSTDVALLALSKVKEVHPTLDTDAFIYDGAISEDAVCIQTDYNCSFVARCT